jgi:hypothetical protein
LLLFFFIVVVGGSGGHFVVCCVPLAIGDLAQSTPTSTAAMMNRKNPNVEQ